MYPQGVCRIRKSACAGNGCAIFPTFDTAQPGKRFAVQPKTIYLEVTYSFCKNARGSPSPAMKCISIYAHIMATFSSRRIRLHSARSAMST